jgi:hypothetical protein
MAIADKNRSDSLNSAEVADIFKPRRKIPFMPIIGVCITAIVAIGVVIGLMWQSNSFIARNQDFRSDASTASTVSVVKQSSVAAVDQRFGVGGNCDVAKKIGVPWTFNWGGGWNGISNESEVNCAITSNGTMSSILTFGHADEWPHSIDLKYNLPDMEQKAFAANPEIKTDYNALKAFLDQHPVAYNRTKILASFLQVPDVVKKYPSAYIQIANEPDWMPYFKPDDFAKYYTYFYRQIRRFDKGAKISFGGLAWSRYNHPQKWDRPVVDWSLWENQFSKLGGSTASVQALSILGDQTHVTRGNQVYYQIAGDTQWHPGTQHLSKGTGEVTSFHQYLDLKKVTWQFYVRGGVVWSRNNSTGGFPDWNNSLQAQINVGAGPVRSFSELLDNGEYYRQYVVRCASDKWIASTNTCTGENWRIFSRFKGLGPTETWKLDWKDVSGNTSDWGQGVNYFWGGGTAADGTRTQIYVRGAQVLKRQGKPLVADKSLINDPYIKNLIANNSANKAIFQDAAWFLIFYKQLQALNPVAEIDYFNIHPYAWTAHNAGGYTSTTIADAVVDTKASIEFIERLRTLNISPSLKSKPIIITEFSQAGNMVGGNCSTIADCEKQTAVISKAYIEGVVPWLKQTSLVHRWLWFNADYPDKPYHGDNGKTILENWGTGLMYVNPATGALNNTAQYYKNQFTNSTTRDKTAPQITKITNTLVNNWPRFDIQISDVQTSAAYEYWYCFGKTLGMCDLRPWSSKISKDKTISLSTHAVNAQEPIYATVKVTDSVGNTSQVVSGLKNALVYPVPIATIAPTQLPTPVQSGCVNPPEKYGTYVTIRAKGVTKDSEWPKLQLHVKNNLGVYELKKTFVIKSLGGLFRSYLYSIPTGGKPMKASQIRLVFVNDGAARDVYVDSIRIGGRTYQTEHCSTYSTGTWNSATGSCSERFAQSDMLNCNGYFDFLKR